MSLISRRSVLRNTAVATLVTPVLRKMRAYGVGPVAPRRAIFVFSPNGPIHPTGGAGPASGSETDFKVMEWWKALQPHQPNGIFISHMAPTGTGSVRAGSHKLGGQTFRGGGEAATPDSVDQIIGKRLAAKGTAGVRRSVVWGTSSQARSGGVGNPFASEGRLIDPELSPAKAWASLFANFVAGPTVGPNDVERAQRFIAEQKSVLDFAGTNCRALQDALGSTGRHMLDEHCTTIRTMEQSLQQQLSPSSTQPGLGCTIPPQPQDVDWGNPAHIDDQMAAFVDLIAMAFACELTHVVAFQFGAAAARNKLAPHYGVPHSSQVDSKDSGPAHHPWTHNNKRGESADKPKALRIFTDFYATAVANILTKLQRVDDANGAPLMDSTVLVWSSELGGGSNNGDSHQFGGIPVMLFGHGQKTFKTGRYLRGKAKDVRMRTDDAAGKKEAGRDHARLLVSVMHYMGLTDVSRVGSADVTGPWDALYG